VFTARFELNTKIKCKFKLIIVLQFYCIFSTKVYTKKHISLLLDGSRLSGQFLFNLSLKFQLVPH
jgi:hypothetical protein